MWGKEVLYTIQDERGRFLYEDTFAAVWGTSIRKANFYDRKRDAIRSQKALLKFRNVKVVKIIVKTTVEVVK